MIYLAIQKCELKNDEFFKPCWHIHGFSFSWSPYSACYKTTLFLL